jgi:enamine deaminase RidA (YjgF/YER057c/UK114 family)
MFETAAALLDRHRVGFQNVLRTWCYLADIDRDYDEFNVSRNVFFQRVGVRRLPASTGIGATRLRPPGAMCSMDLYALLNPDGAEIEVMHTPTLNEAADYGSSFSRGMKLALPDKTVLFISGTASVDERGATAHMGDVRGQIERMLLNVEQLLSPHDAAFVHVVQMITYLKSASYLDQWRKIWRNHGPAQTPNSVVQADVCRPELLCEMEAIAVLPARGSPLQRPDGA